MSRASDYGTGWAEMLSAGQETAGPAAASAAKPECPPDCVLYRIIGNDLPPRHGSGQSRQNLRFILAHEPDFPGCHKRFVVNRIVDPQEEQAILDLLAEAGADVLHLPFDPQAYAACEWDIAGVPLAYAPHGRGFARLSEDHQARVMARLYAPRNQNVINNNGARNAALADGQGRARWVLPWDGNCFLTAAAWQEIAAALARHDDLPVWLVPMARMQDNQALLGDGPAPEALEEPQVILRGDCDLRFAADWFYGRRPKVELFWRLGVPGPWESWPLEPWDHPFPPADQRFPRIGKAGWVARLDSRRRSLEGGEGERQRSDALVGRGRARVAAITGMMDRLDVALRAAEWRPDALVFVDQARLQSINQGVASELLAAADAALQRGPHSVVDKTTVPPSGDAHDYWHPAPYYWPHPLRLPGLPYVRRDGQRVPGTRMYEASSERYDRTRWQVLVDDVWALALAASCESAAVETAEAAAASQADAYASHAQSLLRHWFLNPATAMNPHLRYAQVRRGHNRNQGAHTGVIEFKDCYYFLDALRLLRRLGALDDTTWEGLQDWFARYLQWLQGSEQGQLERASNNNHGTYYDLQVGAIAAFLGDYLLLRDTLRDSRFRIREQFAPDGSQPHELTRADTAHYCCFNLQGWVNLQRLALSVGEDLMAYTAPEGGSLPQALSWLGQQPLDPWPYPQAATFDPRRVLPLLAAQAQIRGEASPGMSEAPNCFHPHDGIMPWWRLARPLTAPVYSV